MLLRMRSVFEQYRYQMMPQWPHQTQDSKNAPHLNDVPSVFEQYRCQRMPQWPRQTQDSKNAPYLHAVPCSAQAQDQSQAG